MGIVTLTFALALLAFGCNSDDVEAFSVDGNWAGTVTEADAEITMILIKQGKQGIAGSALVTVPPEGEVPGTVSGTQAGKEVTFTIDVDAVMVGGSIVFEGAFESDELMSGTVDSGVLGGTFPITFQRQGS